MINKGNARSMCWVCLACFCSVRAIIISWGSQPDTKAMLDDIRSKDKYRWHVARAAVARPILARRGLGSLQARNKAIMRSTQVMVQACGVRGATDIFWWTRSLSIAH